MISLHKYRKNEYGMLFVSLDIFNLIENIKYCHGEEKFLAGIKQHKYYYTNQ